jgi:RNA polymerase sigma-70 factor (ECF subfamily)
VNIPDDALILELLQNGDSTGYRALFDKYYKMLCIQAFFLLKNESESEDLVQDIFIKFWQERKFDAVQQSLGSYLSVAVKNRALNVLKKKGRDEQKEKDYTIQAALTEQLNPLEIKELTNKVGAAVDKLPEQCRQIFELVFIEGKKYQEAADITGVSINTVKTQLQRAFSKLRESLRDYHYVSTIFLSPVLCFLLS